MKKSNEVVINVNGEKRMPAFAAINRELNLKHVQVISDRIKVKGYRKGEDIRVFKCEDAVNEGITNIRDINGNPISNDFENYYLVGDGQHRTYAVANYNNWAVENNAAPIEVPAIIAELKDETISEYINDINVTRKDWDVRNYLESAAELHPNEPLLQVYVDYVKKGYPISTLNKIFCEIRRLGESDLKLLCFGHKKKGKDSKKNVIPAYNIKNGERYINICRSKGFDDHEIAKRYMIDCFEDIKVSHSLEFAFEVMENITSNDYANMTKKDKLIETNVNERFTYMVNRLVKQPVPTSIQTAESE